MSILRKLTNFPFAQKVFFHLGYVPTAAAEHIGEVASLFLPSDRYLTCKFESGDTGLHCKALVTITPPKPPFCSKKKPPFRPVMKAYVPDMFGRISGKEPPVSLKVEDGQ